MTQPTHRPLVVVNRPDPLKHFAKNCAFVKLLAHAIFHGSRVLIAVSPILSVGAVGYFKGWW